MSAPSLLGFPLKRFADKQNTVINELSVAEIASLFKGTLPQEYNDVTDINGLFVKLRKLTPTGLDAFLKDKDIDMSEAEFKQQVETNNGFENIRQRLIKNTLKNDSTSLPWNPPDEKVNSDNLHVALLYPGVASYLKKIRATKWMGARAVRTPLTIMTGSPYMPNLGASIGMFGGGDLNTNYPIEMRGQGPMIASSFRGGNVSPVVLGTVNSPTIWRPITDNSFISESLRVAVSKITAKLNGNGMKLAEDVIDKVAKKLATLESAEIAAKNYRDQLTKATAKFSKLKTDGTPYPLQKDPNNNNIELLDDATIVDLTKRYNNSLDVIRDNERVVLRVVDHLGRLISEVKQ
jgi:hypothetical protein